MAIASMVLGILSLVTCFITGIPAIIMGHIAHSRARRQPAQFGGAGFAVAGLVLGYLSIAATFLLLPALLLPALTNAKGRAQAINCMNNMKQIGLAARMYANDNKEVFPPDFLSMSNELVSPKILTCPSDDSKVGTRSWAQFTPANISYEYLLPGAKVDAAARQEVFRCPIHGSVCYGDGSVMMGGAGRKRPAPSRFNRSSRFLPTSLTARPRLNPGKDLPVSPPGSCRGPGPDACKTQAPHSSE
jgi:hypothetical protein